MTYLCPACGWKGEAQRAFPCPACRIGDAEFPMIEWSEPNLIEGRAPEQIAVDLKCRDCGAVNPLEEWLDPESEHCPDCGSPNSEIVRN